MPELSNWKMPSVWPSQNRSNVFASSSGRSSMTRRVPVVASICSSASSMSVSVLRPRKSILSRPMRSISFMPHWVVISSRLPL